MKRYRKIGLVIVFLCILVMVFSLTGCFKLREKEEGYYKYIIYKQKDGEKYIEITGLTELGSQQKVLVIPEKIKGIDVSALDYRNFFGDLNGIWQSENLEKIFFPTSRLNVGGSTFNDCINLKKFIAIDFDLNSGSGGGGTVDVAYRMGQYLHIPKLSFEECTFNNRDMFFMPANVSYYYNYEIDINDGYYWIDDEDYGSIMTYIPQDPVRDAYEFGGWYKEAECINKWNFETDTLPKEQLDEERNTIYQETKLYAKWIKK